MKVTILKLDIAGNPSAWISHREAISMVVCDRVLANMGEIDFTYKGGFNRALNRQSIVNVGSILLTRERVMNKRLSRDFEPPLTNKGLFSRDKNMCLYCGKTFSQRFLTRDHIVPKSRCNDHSWTNAATCCINCNNEKRNRTPEEWGHLLLAVPFAPNWAEFLYLKNSHRIIADQLEFLKLRFPKGSRLV